jgi:hypothetical protein
MARWGHSDTDYLFWKHDFHAVQEAQRARLKQAIAEAPAESVRLGSDEEAADRFADEVRLYAPELTEGAISATVEETQVDISRDRSLSFQYATFGPGPHYIPGITATYFVPFVGEREMFRCKPSTYTTVIPAAEVTATELKFRFVQPGQDVAATKQAFDRELSTVKQYLGWLDRDARAFNESLLPFARDLVTQRRSRLASLEQGTNTLGIPIRRAAPAVPVQAGHVTARGPAATFRKRPANATPMYDVALSFAGEDREYVDQVANLLRDAGASVFYDAFEKAALWGKNLVDHLADIYQHRSRYVVMFISEHYVNKAWPRHERQHAQARSLVAKDEYILPARFDDAEVPGMTNTVGYIDLRTISPNELVELIRRKIGRSTS